jgi:hypothetical protein
VCPWQHLTKLCAVSTECVAALAVDFWLQTHMHQCGVLWHLILFLFHYDFTLEESGVEKSDQSNQQVSTQYKPTSTALEQTCLDSTHFLVSTRLYFSINT